MQDALWVLVGVFIGAPLGLVIGGMLCSGKVSDMETEILNLRFQRKALRDEIDKHTSPKPKPRKKRTKNAPRRTKR
jgi:hypothetical protein|tara:strand:+ start:3209 stop:3436 length:228 start_codon:yes stop_codon:yes gene_type:complete